MSETMLYRFFDKTDALLYVGISSVGPGRWSEHRRNRPWWHEVCKATVEHFSTREQADFAERRAIQTELPTYNKTHAVGHTAVRAPKRSDVHHFHNWHDVARGGNDRAVKLWLMPEIRFEPCVDDLFDYSGEEQFWYFVETIQRECPDEYEADALPIYWSVMPIHETAPFQDLTWSSGDYLSYFTWPEDQDGQRIDWYSLEVKHDRFPEFSSFLGWKPSALQTTCPIRSIVASKQGQWHGRIGRQRRNGQAA